MEPEQLIARVQELTGRLEDLEDVACRELAEDLTGAVVQMYGAGPAGPGGRPALHGVARRQHRAARLRGRRREAPAGRELQVMPGVVFDARAGGAPGPAGGGAGPARDGRGGGGRGGAPRGALAGL